MIPFNKKLLAVSLMVSLFAGIGCNSDNNSSRKTRASAVPLSTSADLVSGDNLLVRIDTDATTSIDQLHVTVDGHDVTSAFRPSADGVLLGLIDGLPQGASTLRVERRDGRSKPNVVELINHSISGPILYNPQPEPFICTADTAFGLTIVDPATCAAESRTTWWYRSTAGGNLRALPSTEEWPDDLEMTTTSEGHEVPFIVRLEEGTINRAVYQFALLDDPLSAGPDPWTPTAEWNKRLVYTFGGGCNAGWHQGAATGGVLNIALLAQGYALASSTLNVLDQNCNDVISAESAMMVKEHFIETVGVPVHTIGSGGSGGAIQQYLIAENYPGVLDGITPSASFPDATSIMSGIADCRLLNVFFENTTSWTAEQRTAAAGYRDFNNCTAWHLSFASRVNATEACPAAIPSELLYHPVSNPAGLRCTIHDYLKGIYGEDPETGFARRPLDNIGVQYGLQALLDGAITSEQFVALNEGIGGLDIDGNVVATRSTGDPEAIHAAYESGRIISGTQGLAHTPIIDHRSYTDAYSDIHTRFHTFSTRDRLVRANGHADNQLIWTAPPTANAIGINTGVLAIQAMDKWLTNLAADNSQRDPDEKLRDAKPTDLVDGCWDGNGAFIEEPASYDGSGQCNSLYPNFGDPRTVAGAPLTDDILKCELRPLDRSQYPNGTFSEAQWGRLQAVFEDGVCDWNQPGIGQVPIKDIWQRYGVN